MTMTSPLVVSLLALTLAAPAAAQTPPAANPREQGEDVEARLRWEHDRRAYPRKEIPPGVRLEALRQLESMRPRREALAGLPGTWESIGPAPIDRVGVDGHTDSRDASGRVNAIAVDPANPKRWLVGAATGGIWERTVDATGKDTWTTNTDGAASLSIGAIAFDESHPQNVYAGTGDGDDVGRASYKGAGLLKSTDGGRSWRLVAEDRFKGSAFRVLRVHPIDGEVLYAALVDGPGSGILKSTNGGLNWDRAVERRVTDPDRNLSGWATDLVFRPAPPESPFSESLYGALGHWEGDSGNGLYRTSPADNVLGPGGVTQQRWRKINGPWDQSLVGRIALAIAPSRPDRLYVGIQQIRQSPQPHDKELLGLWYTDNAWEADPGKVNFERIDTTPTDDPPDGSATAIRGYCRAQCYYDHVLLVDGDDADTLYAGGVGVWKCTSCTTATRQWQQVSTGPDGIHVDQHALTELVESASSGPMRFAGYYSDLSWCSETSGGGRRKEQLGAASNPYTYDFGSLTPCAPWFGRVSGSARISTSPVQIPNGTLDPSGYTVTLDTPITVTIDANVTWTAPSGGGYVPLLDVDIARDSGDFPGEPECRKKDTKFNNFEPIPAGQSTSHSVQVACRIRTLTRQSDGTYGKTNVIHFKFDDSRPNCCDTSPIFIFVDQRFRFDRRKTLFAGNDGGIWSSTDGGGKWADHNTDLTITQFYGGSLHPSSPTAALVGSQDNGTETWKGTKRWFHEQGGDGGATLYSAANPNRQMAAIWGNEDITRTLDDWVSVTGFVRGFSDPKRQLPFKIHLEKCPANDTAATGVTVLASGVDRVWRADHAFEDTLNPSWRDNGPAARFASAVEAIGVPPSLSDCRAYVASAGDDVRRTTDAGASWQRFPAPNLPDKSATDLEFDPANPNVLWIAYTGYDRNSSREGHLFRTASALAAIPAAPTPTDTGPAFTDVTPKDGTGKKLDDPINAVLVDPANPGHVYIGTDTGVLRSTNNGTDWTPMTLEQSGMPRVPVYDLKTNATGTILAFTHGRGAFRLVSKTADLAITKTVGATAALVGEVLEFTITVRNLGPEEAAVTVTDPLPADVTFVSAEWKEPARGGCLLKGEQVVCHLGQLAKDASATLTLKVTPTKAGLLTNEATVTPAATDPVVANNKATATKDVTDLASNSDRKIVKSHSPEKVNVGEAITYVLNVTNLGPAEANDVVVTDTLPAGLTLVSATASQGSCSGTATITCALGKLAKGAEATVTILANTTTAGTLNNTARVNGKEKDPNPRNDSAADSAEVITPPEADVSITKTASPDPVKVGEPLTYKLTVRNNGPDKAPDTVVADTLPPNVTLVSATTSDGGCSGTSTVFCTLGDGAPAGAAATITIVVTPTKAGRLSNTATVSSSAKDPAEGNNAATATVTVLGAGTERSDRLVVKTHTPSVVLRDGRVTYTIRVTNNGPDPSTGVTLVDTLPPAVTFVSGSTSQGVCGGTQLVTCALGDLGVGQTATVTIVGTAILEGRYANVVVVSGNETDPNPGNDVWADDTLIVFPPAIIRLTPSSARQGTRNIDLKIEGVRFQPGAAVSFQPSTGIEVVRPPAPAFGFVSPVELHVTIHLAENAPLGEREVFVTNPDGGAGGQRPLNVFTVTPGQVPSIRLSPDSISFGTTPAKSPVERTLAIQNLGTGTLTVKAMGINGGPMEIISPAAPFNVGVGSSQNVRLRYNPQAAGSSTRMLVISSNDPARPSVTASLVGTATEPLVPNVDLQPAALNFGTVPVGQTRTLGVTVRNTGNANLVVSSAASGDARFAATVTLPLTLPVGTQQTFNVTFTPNAAGVVNAQLTFASNDPEEPSVAFQLRGEGASAGGSETLVTDDGTLETGAIGDGLTIVNRFTPARYPAQLTKVSVFVYRFSSLTSPTGATIRLIAYADGSGNPSGTQRPLILYSQTVTIPAVPAEGAFVDYPIANGPTISSGDLYVGYAAPNPTGGVTFGADTNGPPRQRGFYSTDGGTTFLGPLTLDNKPANIMIRATTSSGAAASSCTWGVAPAKLDLPKEGGSGTIDVSAPAGCSWDVSSSSPFLTFSGHRSPLAGGTGSGTVRFTAAPYTGDASRSATVTIAQLNSTVGQSAAAGSPGITSSVFVPIVLSTAGVNNAFFTSELTLTNRGSTSAVFQAAYTAALGGGGGTAFDVLPPGAQRVYPDGLAYLKSIGTPIPDSGNRGGTVTLSFNNLSSASAGSATVRTSSNVPEGRAGLAYSGVPSAQALNGTVYLLGLRQNATDRSNLALMNAGTQGDAILRVTVFSGDPAAPISATLQDIALPPGGFNQLSGVLGTNGLALTNGYVRVQKVGGTAPFYAYAVINDQANSDGSFVPPVLESALAGKPGLTLPVIVETSAFLSELIATNFGTARKTVRFSLIADGITAPNGTASFTLDLAAGQQLILPNLLQYLRDRGTPGIPAAGATTVGPLFATVDGGDASGIFVGARTSSAGGGGRYGLFYTAVPTGAGATRSAWLFGLLQDASNRSNVAFVNTGEVDGSTDVFRLEIYDGETGTPVKTVDGVSLAAKRWTQITTVLAQHAPGVSNGYLKITRTSGSNPFLVYAVVNDGGQPGQRSGDGAFVPMTSVDEEAP